MLHKILLVGLLATFEIYVAIGTGMAFNLSSNVIFFTTVTGGLIGVFVAAFLGDKIRNFILKYKKPKVKVPSSKDKMMLKLWEKYGVVGVGFLGTFIVGAPISIGIGYGFGVHPKKLINWCLLAVLIRCFLFSYFFNYVKNLF
jgi:membrane protein DedA with SNARE-associated domain